ncbi:hypothetical protein K491DRAFT_74610 [Lophiostoma macrostomum CBS 122681]|uniref:Uncharacterized protein n=1 Tax=Lophiostoma macrostomum CBS 122681 TaxID=1314788 RepID=A0A6A6SXX2_9PLEO|nr:hypothetical protein K491DRAFT_74610 [Lophiostoma macrostomum CBS 122681]
MRATTPASTAVGACSRCHARWLCSPRLPLNATRLVTSLATCSKLSSQLPWLGPRGFHHPSAAPSPHSFISSCLSSPCAPRGCSSRRSPPVLISLQRIHPPSSRGLLGSQLRAPTLAP